MVDICRDFNLEVVLQILIYRLAPAGAGRCGAEGRFLKKAPQKLFWALRGARYGDSEVILVFLSLARGKRSLSHSARKGKLVFLSLHYGLG